MLSPMLLRTLLLHRITVLLLAAVVAVLPFAVFLVLNTQTLSVAIGVSALLLLQTTLIAGLLVERARRSKAAHGLSESEERYRNVVQTQTELICRYLPDTTITFVNDAYCRYFNKNKEELIGTKFLDLIPEYARQDTLAYVQSLLENPRSQSNEHEAILADGSITWQHWIDHVITNGNGRVKELQGIGRDITERKLAEKALQISEQRFATAFNANPQPMSLTTLAEGRYIDVNESFSQMSGYTRDEVIGNTSFDLRIFEKPEDREKLVGPLRENGSVRNLELKFRRKDGEFRILLSSAELLNLGGQRCVLVASSDITDRKRLEEERLHAENELSQLTARLFTLQDEERRRIARELHDGTAQNLFAISIDIDLMRKQTSNGDSEFKSLLDESASLCDQSLQEIRTLSYLLHPPLLDHAGLVSALRWYVDGFIRRTGIAVNLVALESVGRMASEIETALFRIVQESLTNIRRHSGSEIAGIRLWRNDDQIVLEIEDHGHGIKLTDSIGPIDETHQLGVGIPGMRQRLRQLGGRLDIVTGASGTVVTAIIPLNGHSTGV
jgi:PAS domain S-box-containing protein